MVLLDPITSGDRQPGVPAMSPHNHPNKRTLGLVAEVCASREPLSSGKKAK
jgi:hypothetical protein